MYKKMKFAIIGAGPIGGIMGAYLANAGHRVILVDIMKDHLDEIALNGLKISGIAEMTVGFPKENLCYGIDELAGREIDAVFISVKASVMARILTMVERAVPAGTRMISLQNGLDTEELIADVFGKENAMRIVVNYAGNLAGNGNIKISFFNSPNYMGTIDTAADAFAKDMAGVITDAGLETAFTPEIKKHEWTKTILNAALSPVCALTRRTMKQMMELDDTRTLAEAILREGIEVAGASGIIYEKDFLETCMGYLDKAGHHKTSMHVDLERGSPTEIGFLNEKIVEYGRARGIATPYNSTIVSLIRGSELPEHQG